MPSNRPRRCLQGLLLGESYPDEVLRRGFVTLLAVVAAACGSSDVPATAAPTAAPAASASVAVAPTPTPRTPLPAGTRLEDLAAQFTYDASAPIGVVELGSTLDRALTVRDIEFTGARGGRARAYLITPPTGGPHPGMVFVAGSNQRREDIRDDALAVARRGVVTLVLEQSQMAAARPHIWTLTAQDREEAIETVQDVRRAIDLLIARPDVDRTRIGYYGFSYGAWLGAITAAVDRRVTLLVLRSGGPQILTEIARTTGRTVTPDYLALMATVDQMSYAPSIVGPVLVQNGKTDTTYTAEQIRAWQERVGGMKTVGNYNAGHTLDAPANADVTNWIAQNWRL
jgi:dienelactone hydrolase